MSKFSTVYDFKLDIPAILELEDEHSQNTSEIEELENHFEILLCF